MKKIILLLAFAGLIATTYSQTQNSNEIPAAVSRSFEKSHPNISPVTWSQSGDNYKASYVADNKTMTVTYSAAAKLMETESVISVASLPTLALKYLNDNFPHDYAKKSTKVTSAKGKSEYLVSINQTDITFDSQGKFVKQTIQ
jgi:hypothetical protein